MGQMYLDLLKAFSFTEMQAWIASISALMFSSCLFGGIVSALTFLNSSRLQQRPLKERISYRLFIIGEVVLVIFILYYHAFMIEMITVSHAIYWASAIMMMPLLAIIGSQSIQVVFSGRMKAKKEELERREKAERAKRTKELDAATAADNAGPSKLAMRGLDKRKADAMARARKKS